MDIKTILTSAVIAALVAAYVSLRSLWLKIAIENITKERTKWRDNVREKSLLVHKAIIKNDITKLDELRAEFSLLLNPLDKSDMEILNTIEASKDDDEKAKEFSNRVALLLKHDWERTKLEATPFFARTRIGRRMYNYFLIKTKRNEYEKE